MGAELRRLWRDPFAFALVSWIPVLLIGILCWILSVGVAQNIKIGVVDLDQSPLSRQLTFAIDSTMTLTISQQFTAINEGVVALQGGDIYALVVIPSHLERDTRLGLQPHVTVFNNGQFILIAKLISSALAQVVGTFNGQLGVLVNLAEGQAPLTALGHAVPIRSQITALYNLNSSYAQFLLSAILPAVWQILLILSGLNALSRLDRVGYPWQQGAIWSTLWRTLLPHMLIGWVWGIAWSLLLFTALGSPMHGNGGILLLGLALTSAACVSVGALFYGVIRDPARAISLAGAYSAPGFAFIGVTFPISAMGEFAQFWRRLLPASHYVELQIGQSNYGLPFGAALPHLATLLLFLLPLAVIVLLYQRTALPSPRH